MDVLKYIAEVPDFPKKGILFYDITPMMANPEAYNYTIDKMVEQIKPHNPTKIIGIESRGFFFAPAIALKMGLPFVPVRKKGKLPRETIEVDYALEYGFDTLCVHKSDINKNDKLAIIDDILATGGTAEAICKMANIFEAEVACLAFFMELEFLKGRKRLKNHEVISMFVK